MTKGASPPNRSAGGHMLHGSFWMILLRWTIRLTGLVSTIILARLLSPADFGIVAMAMVVVAMLEVLNQAGQKLAIIRLTNPTAEHYNSAWTISLILGLTIAAAILLVAPFTQLYFHEPRAVLVMQVLALRAAVSGFENIGTVDFRRDLRFNVFFIYNVVPKAVSFFITVSLAFYLRNYWALVAGILTSQLTLTILSYIMHPFRPRLSFARVDDIWSFSIWTFIRTIGTYFSAQIDQIAIGGVAGAASMGHYAVGADVATSPSREINDPMIAVLYPVMSRLQSSPEELRALYLRTVAWSTIICLSTSVGVALVAPSLVPVVLGQKWLDIIPLMGWLALAAGILGVSSATYSLFDALGKPRFGARMQWVRVAMLACAIFPAALLTKNLVTIAMARFFVLMVFVPTLFFAAGRAVGITPQDYLRTIWRPFVAAAFMAASVLAENLFISVDDYKKLALNVVTGAGAFLCSLIALWIVSGRPQSPEADILSGIRNQLRTLWGSLARQ